MTPSSALTLVLIPLSGSPPETLNGWLRRWAERAAGKATIRTTQNATLVTLSGVKDADVLRLVRLVRPSYRVGFVL